MEGSTYKRCRCRDADGRELGAQCPKLRRDDGSSNPNHGSWYFRLELQPDADGKRRTVRHGGFGTQRRALAALEQAKGEVTTSKEIIEMVTVSKYLTQWLARAPISDGTRRGYRRHVVAYLVPHLGELELSALRRWDIEDMFVLIDTAREADGSQLLGAVNKQRIRATLRSALSDAERDGLVTHNAARLVRLPTVRPPPVCPLEPAELGRLLDHVASDALGPLIETLASTGLRRGEALGLRWDDVDLERGVLAVRQQLTQEPGRHACPYCGDGHLGMAFAPPKTSSGMRMVELDRMTTGTLLAHRLTQDNVRQSRGETYVDHGLVFAVEGGNPLDPGAVTKRFTELCVAAGVRPVRLHDLRHGAASLRLKAGADISVVSKVLGHSSLAITSDTYSHLLEGVGREAAERAMALVPRAARPTSGLPSGSPRAPKTAPRRRPSARIVAGHRR